jgi:tRNA (guanine-N7-)-methyltransferase
VRKPRRLSPEELAPYQWQMPTAPRRGTRRQQSGDGSQETETPAPVSDQTPGSQLPAPASLNWRELFGNEHPVEVEVGMGKGLFLLNTATARPETNFFGIEIVRKYQLYATTRFAIRKLPNVKTVCADARWVFRQFVPAGSVAAVHVYFPDPWWKARHKKRRVFTPEFAADAERILVIGGRFYIASDVEEYFGVMAGIVRVMPAFREVRAETSTGSVEDAGYQTNFERKARQKGTPVWRAEFAKIDRGLSSEVRDQAGSDASNL